MASRNGRSGSSSKSSPSCSRSLSFSSPVVCHDICGQSTPLSHSSSHPLPSSASSSISGSWLLGHPRTSVRFKHQLRRVSGVSETVQQPENCWRVSPNNVILLVYTAGRNTPRFLTSLYSPSVASLIYDAWMDAWRGLLFASRRAYDIIRHPSSLKILLSHVVSGFRDMTGHQVIILLLRTDRAIGHTKQRLVQVIRRFRRTLLLPITTADVHNASCIPLNGPGLRLPVRNLEILRERNADNARCVCWVLWTMTDPEAIDSAIRLAGTIRWFNDTSDRNPPYEAIVSTFESCFDATKQLYPDMRDLAYFSGRAILQINTGAKLKSRDHASRYPIPAVSSNRYEHTDPDLHHIIRKLECNSGPDRPTIDFPTGGTNTPAHSLRMSNLFVDLTRVGQNPALKSYESYLSAATTDHQAIIANTLVIWYMFLGGHVEDETFWATDKS